MADVGLIPLLRGSQKVVYKQQVRFLNLRFEVSSFNGELLPHIISSCLQITEDAIAAKLNGMSSSTSEPTFCYDFSGSRTKTTTLLIPEVPLRHLQTTRRRSILSQSDCPQGEPEGHKGRT